mgnify:CR=1 FL=1
MSSRMFQSVIMQMKDASDRLVGVIDGEGNCSNRAFRSG